MTPNFERQGTISANTGDLHVRGPTDRDINRRPSPEVTGRAKDGRRCALIAASGRLLSPSAAPICNPLGSEVGWRNRPAITQYVGDVDVDECSLQGSDFFVKRTILRQ